MYWFFHTLSHVQTVVMQVTAWLFQNVCQLMLTTLSVMQQITEIAQLFTFHRSAYRFKKYNMCGMEICRSPNINNLNKQLFH